MKKIMKLLTNNWQAKIGSVVIAIFFYINLQTSKLTSGRFDIPIEYPILPKNYYYTHNDKKTFKIRLEGFKDLINVHSKTMKVVIDPNDLVPGENIIQVKKIEGIPSKGIQVSNIDEQFKVVIEVTDSKTVPIEVIFDDEPPTGYVRTSYTIKPDELQITGPKNSIDKYSRYVLPRVSLGDKKESFSRTFRATGEISKGVFVLGKSKEINLKVNITRGTADMIGDQSVEGIPVQCDSLDKNLEAEISKDNVTIKFNSPSALTSLQVFQGVKAFVSCNHTFDKKKKKIVPSTKASQLKVKVTKSPELKNVEILNINPEKVNVTYRIKDGIDLDNDDKPGDEKERTDNNDKTKDKE